jgi:hypothetical protein
LHKIDEGSQRHSRHRIVLVLVVVLVLETFSCRRFLNLPSNTISTASIFQRSTHQVEDEKDDEDEYDFIAAIPL